MKSSTSRVSRALKNISAWCVYALIFALPFSKSIIEIAISVALLAIAARKIIDREAPFAATPLNGALFIFLAASCLSFFNTSYLSLSLRGLVSKYTKFVLLYFIVVESIDSKVKLKNLLWIALLSGFIISADGFIQYYLTHVDLLHDYPSFKYVPSYDEAPFIGFPTASFPYPNDLAAWALIFLCPSISLLIFGLRGLWPRLAVLVFCLPLLYLFILTKARGAWAGLAASIPLLVVGGVRKAFVVIAAFFIIVLAVIAVNTVLPSDTRSEGKGPLLKDILSFSSIKDRQTMWDNSWKIFMRHPVIGNGLNTFYRHYAEVREDEYKHKKGSYSHNCYLQMAAETGIVGVASFILLMGIFFVTAIRRIITLGDAFHAALAVGLLAGISAFLLHSFVDTNLYSLNLASLFWFSVGLVEAVIRVGSK